jgi:hypothetical protein
MNNKNAWLDVEAPRTVKVIHEHLPGIQLPRTIKASARVDFLITYSLGAK